MDLTKLRDRGIEHALELFESGIVLDSMTQGMIASFTPSEIDYVNSVTQAVILHDLKGASRTAIEMAIAKYGKTKKAVQSISEYEKRIENQEEHSLDEIVEKNVRSLF